MGCDQILRINAKSIASNVTNGCQVSVVGFPGAIRQGVRGGVPEEVTTEPSPEEQEPKSQRVSAEGPLQRPWAGKSHIKHWNRVGGQ